MLTRLQQQLPSWHLFVFLWKAVRTSQITTAKHKEVFHLFTLGKQPDEVNSDISTSEPSAWSWCLLCCDATTRKSAADITLVVVFVNGLKVSSHDDVMKWRHFPRYWPFVRGIHRSPLNTPHKGQWRDAMMFSLICARINGWVNNRELGDLRRHGTHYDVIVKLRRASMPTRLAVKRKTRD